MPLTLENFVTGDKRNSLNEHHSRDAYLKLTNLLTLAHSALMRIANDEKEQDRFESWFGTYSTDKKQLVYKNIQSIHQAVVNHNIIFRNGGAACEIGDYAYVRRTTGLTKVYLCELFFVSGREGVDSTVGTIIHELSHIVADTLDYAYGQIGCRGLATFESNKAVANADNYQYYCESFS